VNIGPQQISGGSWSWSGPNAFSATTRALNAISLTSPSNVYTLTYTNADGVASTQTFTITVNPTAITPWIEVNGGAWQQISSITVTPGTTVNLAPWPQTGGTWSWAGPSSFTSTSRAIYGIPLSSGSNVYTATYTNADGVTSAQTFTITVNLHHHRQLEGGGCQPGCSLAIVNLVARLKEARSDESYPKETKGVSECPDTRLKARTKTTDRTFTS